jgi:predicted RNA-binding protein YlxR (DUF448 family)/ribosomal protein L30E
MFFRIVRTPDGKVVSDPGNRIQGRGVYICRKPECIQKAKQTDAAGRSLKTSVPMQVYMELADAYRGQQPTDWKSLVGFSIRSGKSVSGVDAVLQAARRGQVHLIMLDSDSARHTQDRIERAGRSAGIPVLLQSGLEAATGKSHCRCLGIKDFRFAQPLLRLFHES